MDDHELYREHRDILEAAIARTCRRFRLSPADAEDFAGEFRLRLVKEDYAILKQFQGRSSLRTYLLVVVMRAFQDWRNARWGKWRPSAEAKRLGPLAQRLETLVVRDRHTLDEADEILRTNLGIAESRASLEAMLARLPVRHSRTFVADDSLEERPAADAPPDSELERYEAAEAARAAARALARAIIRLPAQDQLILRMRFQDCLTTADIARALHLEQKPLYRRIERLLLELRGCLERDGLTEAMAAQAIARGGFDAISTAGGEFARDVRPSERTRSAVPGGGRVR
jgi:RNA polymerase sigma factor for flagellar operon FliA